MRTRSSATAMRAAASRSRSACRARSSAAAACAERSRSAKPASQAIVTSSGMKTNSPDRRAADGDDEADAGLDAVGEVPEQESRCEPDRERSAVEDRQTAVDERDRRSEQPDGGRRGEGEPPPGEQRQRDERDRGDGEPPRRLRRVGGVARERDRERTLERRDHDQRIEAVAARERPEPAHTGQLQLHSCTYSTAKGGYRADCGTLVVPENRHDAGSRLIALPVRRIRSLSAHPGTPVFRLQGGPGITNMTFPDASRFAGRHDVVLVGYRGVDGSSKLDCPEVTSARAHARDFLTEKSFRADAAAFKACATRLQDDGVDLAGYTLPERVDDLDAARRALGYEQIDLLSESAGTRTALIYAWRYPTHVHRSVLIGVNPPGHFLWGAKTTGEQIRRYAALCAHDASCRGRTPDLAASVHAAYDHVPGHFMFLPIKQGNVKAAAFFGLFNATADGGGPLAAPKTIDTLLSAQQGDGSGAWLTSLMAELIFPRAQVWGDVAAVARADTAYARRFYASHADRGSVIGSPGTDLIWAGGRLVDAWPADPDENEYSHVRDSNVESLLIGGSLDVSTPPQNAARELLPHLPNSRQVVLRNLGHTDDFWAYEPAAGTRLIETFLDSGRVDTSLYTKNGVDFTPGVSNGAIAKIMLGVMLGLAVLTVLTLVWMPLRVRRHGAYGRKASTALRSLHALLLGLGGWFAVVLIALTALPTVPVQNETLALVSIAIPVALGIYFASAQGIARFAATAVAAVTGAWLGFHVTAAGFGLMAPLFAIVGATAGANLIVLVLDIRRDRVTAADVVPQAVPA
jgi:pimeloyl-ACP methyl ester carboxylesterase